MSEWFRQQTLAGLAHFTNGYAFSPSDFTEVGLPVIRIKQLLDVHADVDQFDGQLDTRFLIRSGDIVMSWSGTIAVVEWDRGDAWLNQHLFRVDPVDGMSRNFLYHLLRFAIDGLLSVAHGTTMKHITRAGLSRLSVGVPPLGEQRRIAEILDTIDETIQATERVVAKRTAKLEGLIEELGGRWTRAAIAHLPLGDMLDARMDYRGRTPRKLGMEWGGGEIPALSANNVQMGEIDFDRECYLGSDSLYRRWMTHGHTERGDLLITMEAPLGNIARVPDGRRYILSQRVVLLRFSSTLLLNDFAYWYMRSESFQSELRRRSTGTTATGIRRAELERIEVPSLDLQQQEAAAAALSAQELALSGEQEVLRKLHEMRTGLAADLLSGRVRTVAA